MVDKITNIIQLYLNDYKRAYYLRELADELKKPHQTIKPYLEQLVEKQILIKTERKNIIEYKLNVKNPTVVNYLVIAEKQRLIDRIEKDALFHRLFKELSSFFQKNTFIIFGSATREFKKGSDIDLFVIGKQSLDKIEEQFKMIYNKELHITKLPSLKNFTTALAFEIRKNHIILNNPEQMIYFFKEVDKVF